MTTYEAGGAISHADVNYLHRDKPSFEADRATAQENLDEMYPKQLTDGIAAKIAGVAAAERSRRNGHYYRYRSLFGANAEERLFEDDDNLVETSLIDLDNRIKQMTPDQVTQAKIMGGKGISAELGHVDQLGSWSQGASLDKQIRLLPESARLQEAGFVFADTYGEKNRAKISYKIRIATNFDSDHKDSPYRTMLKGVRMRAAADVLTDQGDTYEIVKRSSFLIQPSQFGRDYLKTINEIATLSEDKKTAHMADPLMDKIGKDMIEPFIVHPEFRSLSPGVLAVSSLYFALHRAKQSNESQPE